MLYQLLQTLFPSPCVGCAYLGQALCERCREELSFNPHLRELPELSVCAALYYTPGDLLEGLIHPFKYSHQADLARFLVPPLREALKLLLEPSQIVLVPVPLHRSRWLERGYNQAELLAQGVGRALGVRVLPLLKRVRATESQALLQHRVDREGNLQGAFAVNGPIPLDSQIVLVDDIVTTGSTLLTCAQTLRAAGATKVSALVLADRNEAPLTPWH